MSRKRRRIVLIVILILIVKILFNYYLFSIQEKKVAGAPSIFFIKEKEVEIEKEKETETVFVLCRSLGEFRLTAYCSCEKCCEYWATIRPKDEQGNPIVYTASGAIAQENHTVAVDPTLIPYGTKLLINGKIYVAEDCGGAIEGNRIDIYFSSHEAAVNFAIQYAEVFIIEEDYSLDD